MPFQMVYRSQVINLYIDDTTEYFIPCVFLQIDSWHSFQSLSAMAASQCLASFIFAV